MPNFGRILPKLGPGDLFSVFKINQFDLELNQLKVVGISNKNFRNTNKTSFRNWNCLINIARRYRTSYRAFYRACYRASYATINWAVDSSTYRTRTSTNKNGGPVPPFKK